MKKFSFFHKIQGKKIGLVPTMGALHEGHLSLVQPLLEQVEIKVASIFVNPAQFNDKDDLKKYPRNLDRDLELLAASGVDAVFTPSVKEVYANGKPGITINYPKITNELCGKFRPGHFEGVLLVVAKLFHITDPDYAVFGEKDYQQLMLIEKMTKDLSFSVKILRAPTQREESGLALSSRNERLTDEGRNRALCIYRAFQTVLHQYSKNIGQNIEALLDSLVTPLVDLETIDYAGIYNKSTLKPLPLQETVPKQGALMAVAGSVEGVRLIDNMSFPEQP